METNSLERGRCPLQAFGWATHVRDIHSFEKLTGLGMTFAAAEVSHVLDEHLPTRFGGHAGDDQLIEEETAGGGVRLRLLVHPRLGDRDAAAVTDAFLAALAEVSPTRHTPTRHTMTLAWRQAGIVQVELPATGKIMHLRRGTADTTRAP